MESTLTRQGSPATGMRSMGRRLVILVGALIVASSVGVAALLAGSTPEFGSPANYATGHTPHAVALGDFNGDSKPDLATANIFAGTASVLINNGDGTFRAKVDYATVANPTSVAIGDVNGDAKPDLVTSSIGYPSAVSVFLNRGDGTFLARTEYATGFAPYSVAIGDLNGDSRADIATANLGDDTASVFLNRGNGTFQAAVDYATGHQPLSVAIGELNGDGRPDLAIANVALEASSVSVLVNRGDGSFQPKVDYGTGHNPESVAIGDVNGDGKADLATANTGADTVSVLRNRGGRQLRGRHRLSERTHSGVRRDRRPEPRRQGRSRQRRQPGQRRLRVREPWRRQLRAEAPVRSRSDRTLGRNRRSGRRPFA